jgi:hypothetical protein
MITIITRRDFLRIGAAATVGGPIGFPRTAPAKPISPPLNHITAADTRFGLGNSRPEMIELVKLGLEEGVLI